MTDQSSMTSAKSLAKNLLSLNQITETGCTVTFANGQALIHRDGQLVGTAIRTNTDIYRLEYVNVNHCKPQPTTQTPSPAVDIDTSYAKVTTCSASAVKPETLQTWHERLVHRNKRDVIQH